MGKSVVIQRDKKVRSIFIEYGIEVSLVKFKAVFKEKYPKDWTSINNAFEDHENKQKPGKKRHPMPNPEKYLENTYSVYQKKLKQEKYEKENPSEKRQGD